MKFEVYPVGKLHHPWDLAMEEGLEMLSVRVEDFVAKEVLEVEVLEEVCQGQEELAVPMARVLRSLHLLDPDLAD